MEKRTNSCLYRESNPDFSIAQPLYRLSYCGFYIQNKWLARILEESDVKMEVFLVMTSYKAVEGPDAAIFREFVSTKLHGVTSHATIFVISLFISVRTSNLLHKQDRLFVLFFLHCLPMLSIERRTGWTWIGRDLEGSGHELIKVIFLHLYGGTEENRAKPYSANSRQRFYSSTS
jgi:hypothetical protein